MINNIRVKELILMLLLALANCTHGQEYDLEALFDNDTKHLTINITDEAKSVNSTIESNAEEISINQLKLIGEVLGFNESKELSISNAESWCYLVKDEDGRNGCLAGIKIARDDISGAESWCYLIKDEDSRYGCIAGIKIARDDISGAESWCYMIRDEDGRHGCIAGIKLARDDISGAESWCYMIKSEDGRHGCIAGIKLAREDISGAESWCYMIKNEDGRNGCISDVILIGYFVNENNKESELNTYEAIQITEEINQIEQQLSADTKEAFAMIRELEMCPECLNDPETNELYLQLKSEIQ